MIDEDRTMQLFGYTSDELAPKSKKKVVAVCEECGKYRVVVKYGYKDLCKACSRRYYHRLPTPSNVPESNRFIKDTGIDRIETIEQFGYDPIDLSPHSHRKIVIKCMICGKYRVRPRDGYCDLCKSCAQTGIKRSPVTDEARHNISEAAKNRVPRTEEHCRNLSKSGKGRKLPPLTDEHKKRLSEFNTGRKLPPLTDEHKKRLSEAHTGRISTIEHRQHQSAGMQGIPYDEWTGFVSNGEYCEKFDEACRERIRDKYNHKCFICDKPQDENTDKNGKTKKLAVHHVDKNKGQGCNGVKWKLVPMCASCHGKCHTKTWIARIEYLLEHVW